MRSQGGPGKHPAPFLSRAARRGEAFAGCVALSRVRRRLFRVAAIVLVPLLFLLIMEAGLRLAGIGHPMSFFLPMVINGMDCLIENDRFGWRFFGTEMARAPFPFVIPKVKPPDTIRVFVFGESAAYGDPQPKFRPLPRFGSLAGWTPSRQTL